MAKKIVFNWDVIDQNTSSQTCRARTIGGWLVKTYTFIGTKIVSSDLLFVADRDHEWEPIEPYVEPVLVKKTLAKDFESPANDENKQATSY